MKKIVAGTVLAVLVIGGASLHCLFDIANSNSLTEAEYGRMAQEIVDQSLQESSGVCIE